MRTAAERIKEHARDLGFALVGIAPAAEADGFDRLQRLARPRLRRRDGATCTGTPTPAATPPSVLPEVRSVVMVGLEYGSQPLAA